MDRSEVTAESRPTSRFAEGLRRLHPFGVEIDVDLRAPITRVERTELAKLLGENQLLVFPRQKITRADQERVASVFGPVVPADRELDMVSNLDDGRGLGTVALDFHSDYSFIAEPPTVFSLFAVDVVDGASVTKFANAARALDRLDASVRTQLECAEVVLSNRSPAYVGDDVRGLLARDETIPRTVRPAIVEDPDSKVRYVSFNERHFERFVGRSAEASRALAAQIFAVIYEPGNIYEHRWNAGDVVYWDNRIVHHARENVSAVGNRVLRRVVVAEGVPKDAYT